MFRAGYRLSETPGEPTVAAMTNRLRFAALACLAIAISLAVSSTGAAAGRSCGLTPRIDGVRYDVREIRGALPCPAVRRVVTKFLRDGTVSSKWLCTRGHGSSPFAASCAAGKNVLIRVYAPG